MRDISARELKGHNILAVDHFPKNTELYAIMTTKPLDLKKEDEQHDKERN